MKTMIRNILQNEKMMKIIRYVIVGGITTVWNFVTFWLLKDIAGIEMNIANSIAVVSSIIVAYILNKIFVFASKTGNIRALFSEMLSFFAARAVTMLLDIGLIFLVHTVIGIDEKFSMITKIIVNIVVLIINYILSQYFIFNKDKKEV